jgi:hypothetical protein
MYAFDIPLLNKLIIKTIFILVVGFYLYLVKAHHAKMFKMVEHSSAILELAIVQKTVKKSNMHDKDLHYNFQHFAGSIP